LPPSFPFLRPFGWRHPSHGPNGGPTGDFFLKPKILIVDDHEIVREGLRTLLARSAPDLHVCGEAANANEALEMVKSLSPDLVIMDITMPGTSGLVAAQHISQFKPSPRVLMFTMHDFERLGTEVREAGAQGYVLKSQASRDLILAIQCLLAGGTFFGAPPEPSPQAAEERDPGIQFRVALAPPRSLRIRYT
jgi:DNA-binding NarL/FixJ family response regulator